MKTPVDDVSRETAERLRTFEVLVRTWTGKINLVSKGDVAMLWDRHIADSMAVAAMLRVTDRTVVDLGSGAGFPGLVIAVVRPDIEVTLIESDARKASFLRAARRELDLSCNVVNARIEEVDGVRADVVSARALAPLPDLLGLVAHHIAATGRALLPKGATWRDEIEAARRDWRFRYDVTERGGQDGAGVVLTVTDLERIPHAA